jgi:hypothetical protein
MTSLMSTVVNGKRVENLRQSSNDKVQVICTGTQMHWIDTVATYRTGQLIFVDAPEGANDTEADMPCDMFSGSTDQSIPTSHIALNFTLNTLNYSASLLSADIRQSAYSKALSRAPPFRFS